MGWLMHVCIQTSMHRWVMEWCITINTSIYQLFWCVHARCISILDLAMHLMHLSTIGLIDTSIAYMYLLNDSLINYIYALVICQSNTIGLRFMHQIIYRLRHIRAIYRSINRLDAYMYASNVLMNQLIRYSNTLNVCAYLLSATLMIDVLINWMYLCVWDSSNEWSFECTNA